MWDSPRFISNIFINVILLTRVFIMTRLLLISPSRLYAPDWGGENRVKLHILNLFSFLKNNNIEVEILDLENELGRPIDNKEIDRFKEKSIKLISQYDFNIVAISCWSSIDYLSSIMIANICKNVSSESLVVVGGYHPSSLPSDFIYPQSPFDFIITGEGEISLLNICMNKHKRKKKPEIIQGVPLDLKKYYFLDWEHYKYFEKHQGNYIYLSRGCPFSCSYCMESSKKTRMWRSYSVSVAIKKIRRLIDIVNPKQISIGDACFAVDRNWRRKFLSELIKNKINKIFWAETRIDLLGKEDVDLLSKLNFNIEFGLESCSEKMLLLMQKTKNPVSYLNKCKNIITYMNKKEVPYRIYMLFNHPGETISTYNSSIKFLRGLIERQNKISGLINAQNYYFFPGSPIYYNLKYYEDKFGTKIRHKEWWKEKGQHERLAQDVMPSDTMKSFIYKEDYWMEEIAELNKRCIKKMPSWISYFYLAKKEIFCK